MSSPASLFFSLRRRGRWSWVAMAMPVLLLAAVVAVSALADRPLPRAALTIVDKDSSTLDLHQMSWSQEFRLARLLHEGLVRHDVLAGDMRVMPGLAETWEKSEDSTTFTFHLREGLRWSDGRPLTAEHVRESWRRAMLPDAKNDYDKLFGLLKGGREFTAWRAGALASYTEVRAATGAFPSDASHTHGGGPADHLRSARALLIETYRRFDETVGVEAPDARTLVVELEHPTPHFLDIVAFAPFAAVDVETIERFERLDERSGVVSTDSAWLTPEHLCTSGPFVVSRLRFKRDVRLTKNPNYWAADRVAIDSVEILSIEDPSAQVLAYETGAAEMVADVTAPYVAEMLAAKREFYAEHQSLVDEMRAKGASELEIDRALPRDPRSRIHAFPAYGMYFYNFNCAPRLRDGRPNPFADARVRKAFALAIDKQRIADDVRRLGETPATTVIPPGAIDGYSSPTGCGFDPEEARRLLADAGHANGQGLPVIEILLNKQGGHELIAQAVQRDWRSILGVEVRLEVKETRVFRDDLKNGNFMVSRASWFGDYGDPQTFLDINRTNDNNNDRQYSNPAYDALLVQSERATTLRERYDLQSRAERMLVEEEFPLAPIFRYMNVLLFDAHEVRGVSDHARQIQDFSRVSIDRGEGREE
ncbi:MAG: peptide ABC transporter substrate-binding protein [Phycisphaerales bacterium]|nr:MAG: peptide ABC transporter substrate-binding protein [Phycisphaerales bacterium]